MAAFTADSINISNGRDVAEVISQEAINTIQKGDFLVISGFPPVEILQAYKNGQGERFIELLKPWPHTSQSNQPAIVIPTTVDYREAVEALRAANTLVSDNKKAMSDWQTNMGTVTFKDKDGNDVVVKTLRQIEADNQAQMNAYHPYPWAMRKVEFEAMRAANNEKFAASGFVHKGNHRQVPPNYNSIDNGLFTELTAKNILNLGSGSGNTAVSGTSKTDLPVLNIAGVLTELVALSVVGTGYQANRIKLPPAEDGTRTYDSATGVSVTHATPALAFAAETATNKVVTDRIDMWGFEAFLREINDADPFVYKNGLIQSLATDINSVPTVDDNVRPETYFAWYEGDTTSRGKGVNWQTATEAQRVAIASDQDNKNRIYFDDATGKFYQWCIRGRSFAGAGNGDWPFIDSSKSNGLVFSITPLIVIPNQGISDIVPDATLNNYYVPAAHSYSMHTDVGVYRATRGSKTNVTNAVNGECYFLVCGTVERLNKGAYHPKNNLGTKHLNDGITQNYAYVWSDSSAVQINSKADCFGDLVTTNPNSGNVSGGISARPDGRYYDAIYASGQGGVCRDMRYSASRLTAEDFAEQDLAIKAGEYRGRELLKETKVTESADVVGATTDSAYRAVGIVGSIPDMEGKKVAQLSCVFFDGDMWTTTDFIGDVYVSNGKYYIRTGSNFRRHSDSHYIISLFTDSSIAGEYTHTEVIGDPANILLCDDLKDGWVGSWNQTIPNSQTTKVSWDRPVVETPSSGAALYTLNSGASWGVGSSSIWLPANSENESATVELTAGMIVIASYKTKARMVVDSVNSEIYGGNVGIGDVFASSSYRDERGAALGFSLTGKVNTNTLYAPELGQRFSSSPSLLDLVFFDGKLSSSMLTNHSPLSLGIPNNNSPAFKALNYNVAKNQQGFINYAYAQLTYDETAGDWGDDGKIHIADNQTTMPDENGHVNLVGMAQCVEPIGWLKNEN